MAARDLAEAVAGRRLRGGAARHAVALDRHRERQGRQLPGGGPLHLERQPARRAGAARRVRGGARRHAGRRPGATAGDPADGPFLRPLHGLRRPRHRRGRQSRRGGEGPMTAGQPDEPYALGTPGRRPSSDGAGVRIRPAGAAVDQVGRAGHAEEVVAIKVWQLPVRVIHWGLVAAIAVLTVTGLYIGTPLWAPGNRQLMHDVWSLHIFSGYVFIALLVGRVIFMFTGNRYASWRQFLPVQRHRRALVKQSLKYYLFLDREAPPVVGHNPLAGLTYLVLILMFTVQSITGVALEAIES